MRATHTPETELQRLQRQTKTNLAILKSRNPALHAQTCIELSKIRRHIITAPDESADAVTLSRRNRGEAKATTPSEMFLQVFRQAASYTEGLVFLDKAEAAPVAPPRMFVRRLAPSPPTAMQTHLLDCRKRNYSVAIDVIKENQPALLEYDSIKPIIERWTPEALTSIEKCDQAVRELLDGINDIDPDFYKTQVLSMFHPSNITEVAPAAAGTTGDPDLDHELDSLLRNQ